MLHRAAQTLCVAVAVAFAGGSLAGASALADQHLEAGRLIYQRGVLPSGQALRAQVQTDVAAGAGTLVCASCHGRSGLGVGEGQVFVPAVAGSVLYRPQEIRAKQLYGSRTLRPAYTDESLARAIRSGIDAQGRPLDRLMPRYALDDDDLVPLLGYLKSLSAELSPGVSDTDIHFATIVTADVEPGKRQAMLDVLEAFFGSKAAQTRHEASRAKHSPLPMQRHYQAWRKWNLHVWLLQGAAQTWRAQLEEHYARQPVFAVLGGMAGGAWRPMHEFCEQRRIPCLLPSTDLPHVSEAGHYSLYFSKGFALEARVLARHLGAETAGAVVQVYRNDERGSAAAAEFRRAMNERGVPLEERVIEAGARAGPQFWRTLLPPGSAGRLVLWLDDGDLPEPAAQAALAGAQRIYVSASFAAGWSRLFADDLHARLYAVDPFDPPPDAARRLRSLRVWMQGQGIPIRDERVQANTLFTATLAAQALKHVGSYFHRDYFVERIEHVFDSMVTPSAFPRLSLGPNQRFAAKGAHVVTARRAASGELVLAGEWVVP